MQTSIPRSGQSRAIAGMIADTREHDIVSAFNAEASAVIDFGKGVASNGTERTAVLPDGTKPFMGVTVFDFDHQPDTGGFDLVSGASGGIKPKGALKVLREGRIWVRVDSGLTIVPYTDRGYLRYTVNGAGTAVGNFTNANDGGKTTDVTKAVQFVSAAILAADGVSYIALIELEAVNKL